MIELQNLRTNKDFTLTNLKCEVLGSYANKLPDLLLHGIIKYESNDVYLFVNYDQKIKVKFSVHDSLKNDSLKNFLLRNFYCVAEVINIYDESHSIFLHVSAFYEFNSFPDLKIILSENVKETLSKKGIKKLEIFEENFMISDGIHDKPIVAYTIGDYSNEILEDEKINDDNNDEDSYDEEYNEDDFDTLFQSSSKYNIRIKLYGNYKRNGQNFVLYIKMSEKSGGEKTLVGDKIVFREANPPCLKVMASTLSFTDEVTFISHKIEELFENNNNNNDGYLKIWEAYENLEGDMLLEKAQKVNEICFENPNTASNGTVLTVSKTFEDRMSHLKKGDSLWFTEETPEYIKNNSMKWKEYKTILLNKKDKKIEKNSRYEITGIDTRRRLITIDSKETPSLKRAILSIEGDLTQMMRRERARTLIYKGEAANPKLGLIIEGKINSSGIGISGKKIHKYPAMTSLVMNKIFSVNPPTDNQKKAIEIAINTPDIALILGPPGTGKTTVINAIVERLNEIDNQSVCNKGKVLISSTQHDAITNITERMSINSIPTPKFGKKSDEESAAKAVSEWCYSIKSNLAEKYSYINIIQQKSKLENLYSIYIKSPSKSSAKTFLLYAQKINTDVSIIPTIENLLQELLLEESSYESEDEILKAIRRIRTKKLSFADDGPENLKELYFSLNGINGFSKAHPEILKKIRDLTKIERDSLTKETAVELTNLRDELLEMYLPKPKYKKEQIDGRIIDLHNMIKNTVVSVEDEEKDIILSLYNELDNNISNFEEQLSEYSYAYSSTLQQSVGKELRKKKLGISPQKPNKNIKYDTYDTVIKYDTVIIDEAARATPGDLLIALAQASKRIILVGDPHQLTHTYNEDILNYLGEDSNPDDARISNIKESMFSFLWDKAKEMEKSDGIKRTIVLNNQYRTHRLLGQFVSDNFYKPSGEAYNSPLDDRFFAQDIYDSPLRWINIPHSLGQMQKNHNTYHRDCEADYIVNRIAELKESENGKKYSYGIITFYRGQADLLKKKMKEKYPDYEHEGIRIGSVDAFQGMEFDVIFLSVVRSGVKKFGFLTSANRLCVAMSRQKKLLIVVGDAEMFMSQEAENEIPSMKHLLEICTKEGWVENYESNQ